MPDHICTECGRPLHVVGPQEYVTRGVVVDLAHCITPDCPELERTRSYNERPMLPEIRAARLAALQSSIARFGAAAPK
jgi:hypothetical protein